MVMFAVAFQNELAYAQGSTPWWEKPGAYLYYNDTNVGIGTNVPGTKLQVKENGTGSTWYGRISTINDSMNRSVFLGTYLGNSSVSAHNATLNAWAPLYVNAVTATSGSTVVMAGPVGIGMDAPWAKLDIVGAVNGRGPNLRTRGDIMVGQTAGSSIFFDGAYSYASGNYIRSLGTNIQGFFTTGKERLRITPNGNIGIGTPAPSDKLTVNGNIAWGTNGSVLTTAGNLEFKGSNGALTYIDVANTPEPNDFDGRLLVTPQRFLVVSDGRDICIGAMEVCGYLDP